MAARVFLAPAAKASTQNPERLARKAEALASAIALPPGIEFARFEHNGKKYAISARVSVQVDLLASRVPDVVIRSGDRPPPKRR